MNHDDQRPRLLRGPVQGQDTSSTTWNDAEAELVSTSTSVGRAILTIVWTIAVVVILVAPAAVIGAWKWFL